jgi:large subunit ribosomal protein L21
MYAVVEIAGKQFRVEKDRRVKVPFLAVEPGKYVNLDHVLLFTNDKGEVTIGRPVVEKINVSALVVGHGREKKIIVFRKKRRKGFQRKRGHRQDFTLLEIKDIGTGRHVEKSAAAVHEEKTEKPVKEETKTKPEKAGKAEVKTTTARGKASARDTKTEKSKTKPAAIKKSAAPKADKAKKKPDTRKK